MEHNDGLRTTMLLTGIRDFNYAGMLDDGSIVSCQMYLPMPTHGSTTADFFNPLARHVETTIIEGKAPYPVERTLLTSGMVIGGVDSLYAARNSWRRLIWTCSIRRQPIPPSGQIDVTRRGRRTSVPALCGAIVLALCNSSVALSQDWLLQPTWLCLTSSCSHFPAVT